MIGLFVRHIRSFQSLKSVISRGNLHCRTLCFEAGSFYPKARIMEKNVENKRYGMFKFLSALKLEIKEITQLLSLLTAELQHYFQIPQAAHTSQILSQWTRPTYPSVQGNKRN